MMTAGGAFVADFEPAGFAFFKAEGAEGLEVVLLGGLSSSGSR
jgi:hypothetical protein